MRDHVWLSIVLCAACAEESLPVPVPPSGDLIGTWRYMPFYPDRTPVDEREIVVFGADGLYSISDADGSQSGSYEIDGHDLTIHSSAGGWITTGVAVTADRMIIDALFPAGPSDGLIGSWTGVQSSETESSVVALELRTDGTAHFEQTGSLSEAEDATWIHDDPYALVMFTGSTRTKAYPALPDFAIGEWLYERIP
jgi:hypothetical protein